MFNLFGKGVTKNVCNNVVILYVFNALSTGNIVMFLILPNMVSHVLSFGIAHARPFWWWYLIVCILALGPANSSVGRASDCSSEGRWFEPGLVDIETSLTQLVGSIPTRGTLCFIFEDQIHTKFLLSIKSDLYTTDLLTSFIS